MKIVELEKDLKNTIRDDGVKKEQAKVNKGGAKKGSKSNPRGRPVGSTGKVTIDVKEAFALLLQKNIPKLQKWIEETAEVSPKDAVKLILDIAPYVLPVLKYQEQVIDDKRKEIDYSKLKDDELAKIWSKIKN